MKGRHMVIATLMLGWTGSGCTFSSTARNWNGLKGPEDKPTYYMTTTKVGVNLLIVVPFLGDMGISGLTRDLTKKIAAESANDVRIVQGDTESYFYGFPPFTWIVTPVVSRVSAQYEPNAETYAKDQAELQSEGANEFRWYKPWSW